MSVDERNAVGVRSAVVAAALGAASIFLPQWDPDDHWATPDRHVVVVSEQADEDPLDPHSITDLIAMVDAQTARVTLAVNHRPRRDALDHL